MMKKFLIYICFFSAFFSTLITAQNAPELQCTQHIQVNTIPKVTASCILVAEGTPWFFKDLFYAFKAADGWAYNADCEYNCKCPVGYAVKIGKSSGACVRYSLAAPNESPKPNVCTGNPIDISNGYKIQREDDVLAKGIGQVSFSRSFKSGSGESGSWFTNYERKIHSLNSAHSNRLKAVSSPYALQQDACLSGWGEIKNSMPSSWANATASFSGNTCHIIKNGVTVRSFPIVSTNTGEKDIDANSVQLQREDGSLFNFEGNNTNWVSYDGSKGTLEQVTVIYDFVTITWHYTNANGEVEEYSDTGKLLSITNPNGVKQNFTYDPTSGLMSNVTDSLGGQLTFAYTNSKLTSLTSNDGKVITYSYATNGLINDVKYSDNTHRKYQYEDTRFPTYLTGITDERNVRYATWTYDAQGRAISSEHAGGAEKTLLTFNADGSTTVTNALNKKTIYKFADIAGARRATSVEGQATANCVGANQNYTYTSEGWVESKTDWNGNKAFYKYNTKGQEISRTEAYGTALAKTIATEWHATLNLKTKVTEFDKETIYIYDTNGLLKNQSTRLLTPQ